MPCFALVDCNNFYASCERVFQPALKNKPVVILSSNDGCIIARSNEAKALGIPMGAPIFKWQHVIKQHQVKVFSANFALYGDLSARVMEILTDHAPVLEIYSIDEAFLDLSFKGSDCINHAQQIRERVLQWVGIPVSIGIAPTKTLAKVANFFAKKSGDTLDFSQATQNQIDSYLIKLPVGEIWGIGRQYAKLLTGHGINNALEFKNAPDTWIRHHLHVVGLRTAWELRGISCLDLEEMQKDRKSIITSLTFGEEQRSQDAMEYVLANLIERALQKLREAKLVAGQVSIYIQSNRFKEPYYFKSATHTLDEASDYTPRFLSAAKVLLKQIYHPDFTYKKAGILLNALVKKNTQQLNLYGDVINARETKLMDAVDKIQQRWGKSSLSFGATGLYQAWRPKHDERSPNYTGSWQELPIIVS